jgi:hypothetical protein
VVCVAPAAASSTWSQQLPRPLSESSRERASENLWVEQKWVHATCNYATTGDYICDICCAPGQMSTASRLLRAADLLATLRGTLGPPPPPPPPRGAATAEDRTTSPPTHNIASHHITSHHITSRHVTSRHVTSHHSTAPHHITAQHSTYFKGPTSYRGHHIISVATMAHLSALLASVEVPGEHVAARIYHAAPPMRHIVLPFAW